MIRSVHQDFDARIREALRDSVDALQEADWSYRIAK